MDLIKKLNFLGNELRESSRPLRLDDPAVLNRPHICGFFNSHDDEFRVTIPFILEGLKKGEKAFHTVDPARRAEHLHQLVSAGIDTNATRESCQLEVHDWTEVHLAGGLFDMSRKLAGWEQIGKKAKQDGFPLVRFVTHMEWALEEKPGVGDLLEYEARANYLWLRREGPFNPVICAYDLTKFSGDVVVDVMRTHPLIIIGGIIQENPFFVPPDEFLQELKQRRNPRVHSTPAITAIGTGTDQKLEEVKHLKSCLNDLSSVLALPAIWTGREPDQIITALLDVLTGILRLDVVYAEVKDPAGGASINMTRYALLENSTVGRPDISRALNNCLKEDFVPSSLLLKHPAGDLSILPLRLGFQNEIGWVVAASRRADFPTETERLLLTLATNQTAIWLQEARLLSQQKRIARELEEKVAQRTRELQNLKDQLQRENVVLREQIDEASMFEEIVGTAPVLQSVLLRVAKVAPTDSTVLITGETGTGKELIARAIHKRSVRSARAFVKVNCAAIPPSLIGSELFGHEKGAFTGALQRRLGRFELARGGTLFLDEVGELPAETQISLLRVLQEREFERVGGTQPVQADVRVIAATNRDLKTAISKGAFRSDLLYRLNVFPIEMPSLRARSEDIALLAEYFIQRYAHKLGKKISSVSKKTLDQFRSYSWPGNIRELQNVIERSLILCETESFSVDENWLMRESSEREMANSSLAQKLTTDEKALIETALAEARGRVSGPSGAAGKLGLPASTLESKIRSLKINKQVFKTS